MLELSEKRPPAGFVVSLTESSFPQAQLCGVGHLYLWTEVECVCGCLSEQL